MAIKRTEEGIIIMTDDVKIDMSRIKPELKDKFVKQVRDFHQGGRVGVGACDPASPRRSGVRAQIVATAITDMSPNPERGPCGTDARGGMAWPTTI